MRLLIQLQSQSSVFNFVFVLFLVKVPRLHCLVHRKLAAPDFLHGSPVMEVIICTLVLFLLSKWNNWEVLYSWCLCSDFWSLMFLLKCFCALRCVISVYCMVLQPKPHLLQEIRAALLRHLTTILGSDAVAAHFVLLHFLSRVSGFLSRWWWFVIIFV